jgi:uncharacterized protein (DUF433 family)
MTAVVDAIPLAMDAHGVFRVGGTRVTLDLVIAAFQRGATAEEIAQDFPSIELSDVYQVIGYYLTHSSELAGYFEARAGTEGTCLRRTEKTGSRRVCAIDFWHVGSVCEVKASFGLAIYLQSRQIQFQGAPFSL